MSKVALITGGSRGIGLGIAKRLASLGYNIAINGVRNESEIGNLLNEFKEYGIHANYYSCNIADISDQKSMLSKIHSDLGPINFLVNNAGVAPKLRADLLDMTQESYDHVMDTNLKGVFFLSQTIAKNMVLEKSKNPDFSAKIINVTSISANTASVNRGEYCISKAGLSMMSQLLSVRLGENNIPVFEIRPGIIKTDMTSGVTQKYDDLIAGGLTINPRWGIPEDIANVVESIANDKFDYATGMIFTIDGGLGIRRL